MEQKEIEEGNKLIAEFMGTKQNNQAHFESFELPLVKGESAKIGRKAYGTFDVNGSLCSVFELKYHFSWNWLMPVVKKINQSGCMVTINMWTEIKGTECVIYNWQINSPQQRAEDENPIVAIWTAVVDHIKYHNSQPTKNHSDDSRMA